MKRIAIVGGGIAGLAAAYELEWQRIRGADIDWTLYEASPRLGGTVETTRQGGFTLEGGPDAWVTEKPWARDLAVELGLESQLIYSNDDTRKTYILIDGKLQPMPANMRMMVPEDLAALEDSPLFSMEARAAYAAELTMADELRAAAPADDESVASFVCRHFGDEVLRKIGAPLLSGVFGGNVEQLSVQAVMPAFVAMEREYGSLIAAIQAKARARGNTPAVPIFTSLREGMGSLTDALIARLPAERIRTGRSALSLKREGKTWCLRTSKPSPRGATGKSKKHFHHVVLATPLDATRSLLAPIHADAASLLPLEASSAVLVTFTWNSEIAATFVIPPGFGFLVPPAPADSKVGRQAPQVSILACTFADQKFPHRAPEGARMIRVFYGGGSCEAMDGMEDAAVAAAAHGGLAGILQPLPAATSYVVRRWPRSLPQYEVGHMNRMRELDGGVRLLGGITLLGNSYRGVGLPDLIRDSRAAMRSLAERA